MTFGGFCWHCHWGWPKRVWDIFAKARKALGGNDEPLLYGPAHVVWSDENWDCAEGCIEDFDKYKSDDYDESVWQVVMASLQELVTIPLAERDLTPDDYDGQHPEKYPPPKGSMMVKDGAEYMVTAETLSAGGGK